MVATRRGARTDPGAGFSFSTARTTRRTASSKFEHGKAIEEQESSPARSMRHARSINITSPTTSKTLRSSTISQEQDRKPAPKQSDQPRSIHGRAQKTALRGTNRGVSAVADLKTVSEQGKDGDTVVKVKSTRTRKGTTTGTKSANETQNRASVRRQKAASGAPGDDISNAPGRTARRSRSVAEPASQEVAGESAQTLRRGGKVAEQQSAQTHAQKKPLSPKKITQVKRKIANVGTESLQTGTATSTSRRSRRNVTDENASLPETTDKLDPVAISQVALRQVVRSTRRTVHLRQKAPDSDVSMSSGPTTPPDSPVPSFEQPKNLSEDHAGSRESLEASEIVTEDVEVSIRNDVGSEDELAGPKTPMRRSSRNTANANALNRRGLRAGSVVSSRGPTSRSVSQTTNLSTSQFAIQSPDEQLAEELLMAEPSHEQDTIHSNTSPTAHASILGSAGERSPRHGQELEATLNIVEDDTLPDYSLFADEELFTHVGNAIQPGLDTSAALQMIDTEPIQQEDVNETIVMDSNEAEHESFTSDNSVIRHSERRVEIVETPEHDSPDHDDDDYTRLTINPKTPRPETINWYHVEPNTVLRDTLNLGLSPNLEQSQLGILPDAVLSSPTKRDIAEEVVQQLADDEDQTVEFTEFITMSGGAELTPSKPTAAHAEAFRPVSRSSEVSQTQPENAEDPLSEITSPAVFVASRTQQSSTAREDCETPRYMQSTIAFDARRKSLPAKMLSTPIIYSARPKTSDGAGVWNIARSHEKPKLIESMSQSPAATHVRSTSLSHKRSLAPFSTSTPTVKHAHDRAQLHATTAESQAPYTVAGYSRFSSRINQTLDRGKTQSLNRHRSPVRTPLRSITGTPGIVAMTPHPAMPLRGVMAIVEIYTCEGASASAPFVALLHRLGAKTTKIWSDRLTHVIFKDGSPTTLQRVASHNRRVASGASGNHVHCVNSRWVSDCDSQGARVQEGSGSYVVSTEILTGSAKRKRKSMEPTPMVNIEGNLIRDRQSSWGRNTGRCGSTPSRSQSPVPDGMLPTSGRGSRLFGHSASPATPAWIAAPDRLVQATAPVKRIRLLAPVGGMKLSSRRMTNWNNA